MIENSWHVCQWSIEVVYTWELSVKSSKESTETVSLLKTGNKVVEVGWVNNKVEDNNSMRRGPSDLIGHPPGSYQAGECKQNSAPIFVLVDWKLISIWTNIILLNQIWSQNSKNR
jgi:hypothetical protein